MIVASFLLRCVLDGECLIYLYKWYINWCSCFFKDFLLLFYVFFSSFKSIKRNYINLNIYSVLSTSVAKTEKQIIIETLKISKKKIYSCVSLHLSFFSSSLFLVLLSRLIVF